MRLFVLAQSRLLRSIAVSLPHGLACTLATASLWLLLGDEAIHAQNAGGLSVPSLSYEAGSALSNRPEVLPRDAAELEIALGRIRLVPDRFRIVRKHEQFDWPAATSTAASSDNQGQPTATRGQCSRSLQVVAEEGRPTVKLSYQDPQEKWTLTVDNIVGAEWTRELPDGQRTIEISYSQRPHQPIVITIAGISPRPIQMRAATLWHFTEQMSPEFEQYVLPALVRLNSTWRLPEALAAAKRMRGQNTQANSTSAKHELAQCIAELDSTDRRVREVAKQKLREAGLAAQIPLQQLRGGPLSPQQRSTLDELLGELEPRSADTPTRLAYWLTGDPTWR